MERILIAGTGGFAKELLHLIYDLGRIEEVVAFVEPDSILEKKETTKEFFSFPILPYSKINSKIDKVIVGIGDSNIREKIVTNQLELNQSYINLIHPSVRISPWNKIGEGAIICANSVITVDIEIGKHCQLNLATTIGHDCTIGDYFTTAPGVHISGNCNIGNHVYIGTGAVIKQGVFICNNVTIGMGSIVTKDINESGVYVGSPAKKLVKI
uniref:acetyltransferase n=1 Tax=Flavobacterium sp. TaxID=239 RepID=UPI00404B3967